MKRKPLPAKSKVSAFIELTKPRITILILISTALGYYLAESEMINYLNFFYTILGTAILSGGAGTINHCIEKDLDMLMDRTKSRPIPAGLISIKTALSFGLAQSIIGFAILWVLVNQLTAILGLATIVLYLFVYTPLKKITWLNTTVGAIPGAMPALGGWAASANQLSPNAWILFAILFLWQHPHFYAIAIMCKDDYERAGFKMLPVIEKENHRTIRQIIWHAFLLIPVSLYFVVTGALGIFYFWGALLLGIVYLASGIPLLKESSIKNAKLLLRTSVVYLPLLLIIILIDLNYY
ncbi:MAG: protoheme IX farnesyltransferase [Candidatus Marinimicrobia bacterium]|nr:protoheme IX farnesyltransferase [Candidatus Neomarinimicrobiota bacterium]